MYKKSLKVEKVVCMVLKKCNFHNIKVQGEASNADLEAAAIYSQDAAKTVNEGSSPKQQIFPYRQKSLTLEIFIAKEIRLQRSGWLSC